MTHKKTPLRSLLVLLLTLCILTMGMAAHAESPDTGALKSLTVNGVSVDLSEHPNSFKTLDAPTACKVEWKFRSGWKLSSGQYMYSGKLRKLKNGGKVRVAKNGWTNVTLCFTPTDGGESSCYQVVIYNGKPRLLSATLWIGMGERNLVSCQGVPYTSRVLSIQSSDSDVLEVHQGERLEDCWLTPKKEGKSTLSLTISVNGEPLTLNEAVYTVKQYNCPLSELKVEGKKVALEQYSSVKVSKNKTRIQFKLAKGWKLKSCSYYDAAKGKTVRVKSGGTVKTPRAGKNGTGGAWVSFVCQDREGDELKQKIYLSR